VDTHHGRLVVIDSDPQRRASLAQLLSQLGHEVAIPGDSQEALRLAAAPETDLILLDLDFPPIKGRPLLEYLQADHTLQQTPVLLLADDHQTTRIIQALELGAADYLAPPVNQTLLRLRVSTQLEKNWFRERKLANLLLEDLLALERDLEIARSIQQSFLPETLPKLPGWEIAARFEPARMVAGDFYDVFPLASNRHVALVIADVCDKGVGAALFMAIFRSLIRAFAQYFPAGQPAQGLLVAAGSGLAQPPEPTIDSLALKSAVSLTNNYIATTHARASMFATMFFGMLDPATGHLLYINAGHNPPVLLSPTGIKTELRPTGPAVGLFPYLEFGVSEAQLAPGDLLFTYTDGVTEAHITDGQHFGEERLLELLAQPITTVAELLERITKHVQSHMAGASPFDDITLLAVRRTASVTE
jgi:sigma-B regulation protein RsbU (phosphoserine phosphatase)